MNDPTPDTKRRQRGMVRVAMQVAVAVAVTVRGAAAREAQRVSIRGHAVTVFRGEIFDRCCEKPVELPWFYCAVYL